MIVDRIYNIDDRAGLTIVKRFIYPHTIEGFEENIIYPGTTTVMTSKENIVVNMSFDEFERQLKLERVL